VLGLQGKAGVKSFSQQWDLSNGNRFLQIKSKRNNSTKLISNQFSKSKNTVPSQNQDSRKAEGLKTEQLLMEQLLPRRYLEIKGYGEKHSSTTGLMKFSLSSR
jgi:hypothetical protein